MRLTVLVQMTKGTCLADAGWTGDRLRDLERLRWLLWHGHATHAVDAAQGFADDAWGMEEDAAGDAKAKPKRLRAAAEEFATYLRRNAGQLIDYGERHRAGERISTGFVESAVNQVVSKRFSKRQSMRWTQRGAHLMLQTRTHVLNGELEDAFRRRWPAFHPPARAEAVEESGSFALPPPPAITTPVAPVCDRLQPTTRPCASVGASWSGLRTRQSRAGAQRRAPHQAGSPGIHRLPF